MVYFNKGLFALLFFSRRLPKKNLSISSKELAALNGISWVVRITVYDSFVCYVTNQLLVNLSCIAFVINMESVMVKIKLF